MTLALLLLCLQGPGPTEDLPVDAASPPTVQEQLGIVSALFADADRRLRRVLQGEPALLPEDARKEEEDRPGQVQLLNEAIDTSLQLVSEMETLWNMVPPPD